MLAEIIAGFALVTSVVALAQRSEKSHRVDVLEGRLYEAEQTLARLYKSNNKVLIELEDHKRMLERLREVYNKMVVKLAEEKAPSVESSGSKPMTSQATRSSENKKPSNSYRDSIMSISSPSRRSSRTDDSYLYTPSYSFQNDDCESRSSSSNSRSSSSSSSYDSGSSYSSSDSGSSSSSSSSSDSGGSWGGCD